MYFFVFLPHFLKLCFKKMFKKVIDSMLDVYLKLFFLGTFAKKNQNNLSRYLFKFFRIYKSEPQLLGG